MPVATLLRNAKSSEGTCRTRDNFALVLALSKLKNRKGWRASCSVKSPRNYGQKSSDRPDSDAAWNSLRFGVSEY
ncbi:hypothetical protein TNCV_2949501 [Trichonephila clavipes]|nr:hypothetical protein TNCV_2949501 [Trichonephila clavipes]